MSHPASWGEYVQALGKCACCIVAEPRSGSLVCQCCLDKYGQRAIELVGDDWRDENAMRSAYKAIGEVANRQSLQPVIDFSASIQIPRSAFYDGPPPKSLARALFETDSAV